MEASNQPILKENDLPNLHYYVPCQSSGVYNASIKKSMHTINQNCYHHRCCFHPHQPGHQAMCYFPSLLWPCRNDHGHSNYHHYCFHLQFGRLYELLFIYLISQIRHIVVIKIH